MRLSTKTRYGLRAMVEIARAYPSGPVKRKEISLSQEISVPYLENILSLLRKGDLIGTTRGANGGFELLRPPEQITLLDVMTAVEGTVAPVDCLEGKVCDHAGACTTQEVWRELRDLQVSFLTGITLQTLLDRERAPGALTFDI